MSLKELSKDQFIDLRKECRSDAEMSRRLNCSRQYLNYIRKSLGVNSNKGVKSLRDEKIFKDSLLKMSMVRMSRKYKLSVCHIYRIIKKMEEDWKKVN